ncbi:DUF998 domain-containing protein [Streptomyces spectabilis]|uniref:DUF998 domain-containing protein n=1 Tax=Streptomyces spectabilis TaxID=68270 RepID=A0A516RJ39_STRST|nr:DUF998 domain-containing protein [Streptomyces spectabilis]QDQ15677.1 DUF998 domain-containing protein [Streptomyces spectabilis]
MAPPRTSGDGGPVLALFLLAPFVGEFLLGNLTVPELGLGVLLAPLYGCGALLVREAARRTGGGWPVIALLAAAYALIEEGPVDQLLWNDSYAGQDLLHGPSYVPGLGTGVELVQAVLALHTVWSVCVPIALVEACVPARRTTPWLGRRGLVVTAVAYVLGAALVFWGNYAEEHFLASPAQLALCGAVVVGLVVLALRLARRGARPPVAGSAPAPWRVGAAALAGTSLYWGPSVLLTADWFEWIGVALWCAVAGFGVRAVGRWSRQEGWGARHVCALAAGALLTYVRAAFPVRPESGGSLTADLVSNAVCGALALTVLARAVRTARLAESERPMTPAGPSRSARSGGRSYGG